MKVKANEIVVVFDACAIYDYFTEIVFKLGCLKRSVGIFMATLVENFMHCTPLLDFS